MQKWFIPGEHAKWSGWWYAVNIPAFYHFSLWNASPRAMDTSERKLIAPMKVMRIARSGSLSFSRSHLARRGVSAWSLCSSPCRFVCQFCWSSHWPQLRRKHETATLKMKIMRIMRFIHFDASALFARGYYLQLSELITVGAAKCSIIFQISYNFWPHDL